jgi:hypothetical protein
MINLLLVLRSQFGQVFVEQTIRDTHHLAIESIVAAFPAADQKQRSSPLVEGIENPDWSTGTLNTQLAHDAMARAFDVARMRKSQRRSESLQFFDVGSYVDLLTLAKGFPPLSELVGVLHFPCHGGSISNIFP